MTKKKSSLWLHRPRRRSLQRHTFFSQLCRKLPPEILNDLYESSQQSERKHKCTPLKGSTPKSYPEIDGTFLINIHHI